MSNLVTEMIKSRMCNTITCTFKIHKALTQNVGLIPAIFAT